MKICLLGATGGTGHELLKRLVSENGRLFLKAENVRYPDLIPVRELLIQGVMRAVVHGGESPRAVV